jgi:CubicO group peptidase (beta-lactamase class C family)
MIALAGHLAEVVTGETWEDLVQDLLLTPLGMTTSTPWLAEVTSSSNWARPYVQDFTTGAWEELPANINEIFQALAPAGSMSISANDITPWLLLHLNKGFVGNESFVSSALLEQAHTPSFLMAYSNSWFPQDTFSEVVDGYGFGWIEVRSDQGYQLSLRYSGNPYGQSSPINGRD